MAPTDHHRLILPVKTWTRRRTHRPETCCNRGTGRNTVGGSYVTPTCNSDLPCGMGRECAVDNVQQHNKSDCNSNSEYSIHGTGHGLCDLWTSRLRGLSKSSYSKSLLEYLKWDMDNKVRKSYEFAWAKFQTGTSGNESRWVSGVVYWSAQRHNVGPVLIKYKGVCHRTDYENKIYKLTPEWGWGLQLALTWSNWHPWLSTIHWRHLLYSYSFSRRW